MCTRLRLFVLLGIPVLLGLLTAPLNAQLANQRQTLAGHQRVFLSVAVPESVAAREQFGLKKESLERFISGRLNAAGLEASSAFTDQTLILEVTVDLVKVIESDELEVYAFISSFEAVQAARLATNRQAALATTWRANKFGAVNRSKADLLRNSVIENLEQFLADWQAVQEGPLSTRATSR